MPIEISPGLGVTAAEIHAFDELWMTDAARQNDKVLAEQTVSGNPWPGPWTIGGELMAAMVRMYDLTHGLDYVGHRGSIYRDHLYELSCIALDYRDDRRPNGIEDPFRGRVMPSWGEDGPAQGDLHWAGLDTAGLYSYPIAAFARIVAEDPDLHTQYGDEAVRFAKAVLETLRAYVDELRVRPDGASTFVFPQRCATLITPSRCGQAYINATNALDPTLIEEQREGALDRLQRIKRNCENLAKWAGDPIPHNQAHALVMAMIEEWRALESPYLRERISHDDLANWGRGAFPRLINDTHAWFRPQPKQDEHGRRWLSWHYADDVPDSIEKRTEDSSHGGFSMRYVGVLHRNIERINVALFDSGREPIDVSSLRRGLANTFVFKVGAGLNVAHDVDGFVNPKLSPTLYNGPPCNGWLDLAGVDDRVYYKCREIALREVGDEGQIYLGVGSHASLLANKPALTRRLVNRSAEFGTPPASAAPTAWLIDSLGAYNVAYCDTSGRLHELWRDAGDISGTTNLTASAGIAPRAAGTPSAYVDTANSVQMLLYRCVDGGIHVLYWSTGQARHEELSPAGAPKATGDPVGWFRATDGVHHVVYRSGDGHINVLWWAGADPAKHEDVTSIASAPPAKGDISAYLDPVRGSNMVFYRSADGHIRSLYWSYGDIGKDDLSGVAGTPPAAGGLVAYYTPHDDTHQAVYRGEDGHHYELFAQGTAPIQGRPLTPPGGAFPAAGNPAAYYNPGTNTKHVVYSGADGRLHELRWAPGAGTAVHHGDVVDFAAAPPAEGRPVGFTVAGRTTQHLVYRGDDGNIYEVLW
jgi:hypothetical protein